MKILFTGIRKSDNKYYTLDGNHILSTKKYIKTVDSKSDITDEEFTQLLVIYNMLKKFCKDQSIELNQLEQLV